MLALTDVSYRYVGARAPSLRGVSLAIGPGEVVGLVGASESGKSTLCLVASGLAPRSIAGTLTGTVTLDGRPLAELPPGEIAGRVGIAFQDPASQLTDVCATVFEEIAFGPMNLGLPADEILSRTREALAALAIDDLAPRDPDHLSGGQRQLVAVADILAMGPELLILDEPTAELDPAGTALVASALRRLADRGRAILIAEHKTDLLSGLCQRVVVLANGSIARSDEAGEVWADPALPGLGVDPPTAIRLARLAEGAGVDPGRLAGVA